VLEKIIPASPLDVNTSPQDKPRRVKYLLAGEGFATKSDLQKRVAVILAAGPLSEKDELLLRELCGHFLSSRAVVTHMTQAEQKMVGDALYKLKREEKWKRLTR